MKRLIGALVCASALLIPLASSAGADDTPCTGTRFGPGVDLIVSGPTDDGDVIKQFACLEDAAAFVHAGFLDPSKHVFAMDDNGFIAETGGGWVARVGPAADDSLHVIITSVAS